jgi:hypothetical protein
MPKFNRISLMGSEELFRPTRVAPEPVSPADEVSGRTVSEPPAASPTAPAAPIPGATPLLRGPGIYRIQMTEPQVRLLIEGVQRMKYPHQVKPDQKPSIEEFEELESIRNTLLDAIE